MESESDLPPPPDNATRYALSAESELRIEIPRRPPPPRRPYRGEGGLYPVQQHEPQDQDATVQEATAALTSSTATNVGADGEGGADVDGQHRQQNKILTPGIEPIAPLPQGLPYNPTDYPELDHVAYDGVDHRHLVRSFKGRLFPKDPSPALAIAYSHRDAAAAQRQHVRDKKKTSLAELYELQRQFNSKKAELLELNSQLKESSANVGKWTRKVFDLELKEPCTWNDKLTKLQSYVAENGRLPESSKRSSGGTDVERQVAAFVAGARNKVKNKHASMVNHPHRMEALEKLGVQWKSEANARFDDMFDKLLAYKKEHGTIRMPSLDLCKESGDEELIALHNWVFSQVGSFRYSLHTKSVSQVRRFLDAGFSFEKWYGTNGHVYGRSIPKFDEFCRRYVENGGTMDPDDEEELRKIREENGKKVRKKYKKRKRKSDDGVEEAKVDEGGNENKTATATTAIADSGKTDENDASDIATESITVVAESKADASLQEDTENSEIAMGDNTEPDAKETATASNNS